MSDRRNIDIWANSKNASQEATKRWKAAQAKGEEQP